MSQGKGLAIPHADIFGDPEGLPIISARAGEIALLESYAEGDCVLFNMPASCLMFELSAVAMGDEGARMALIAVPPSGAADVEAALALGLHRVVPAEGQIIECRRAETGDVLIVKVLSGVVELRVHAHLGA